MLLIILWVPNKTESSVIISINIKAGRTGCQAASCQLIDHCDNDGVLDLGNHVDQDDPRLARVKEELGDKEGAEDLRDEAVQSSQAGESLGSSRRI